MMPPQMFRQHQQPQFPMYQQPQFPMYQQPILGFAEILVNLTVAEAMEEASTVMQPASPAVSVNQTTMAMPVFSSPKADISRGSRSTASSKSRQDKLFTPEAESYSDKAKMAPKLSRDISPFIRTVRLDLLG